VTIGFFLGQSYYGIYHFFALWTSHHAWALKKMFSTLCLVLMKVGYDVAKIIKYVGNSYNSEKKKSCH
jgi:hypothetical protein